MEQPTAQAPNQTNITVQDLRTIKYVIDEMCKSGQMKPSDMVRLGTTYEKVVSTISSVTANFDAQAED